MSDINKSQSDAAFSTMFQGMGRKRVIKVRDHVYVAVGYALANMIMIEGDDGIIIVDTTESEKCASRILRDFRKITSKPIKAIILTHFHGDHISGTAALLDTTENEGKDVKIFAHSTLVTERNNFMVASDCNDIGVARQFGTYLKKGSALNFGKDLARVVDPTHTFDKELNVCLSGVNLTLYHTPGETNDQITVWIPEWKVVMPADNIYKAFPNLCAIRGSPPRNSETWYKTLGFVRRLKADFMVPSHLDPVIGAKEVDDILTHYRDAIQFVNDQTVRLLNNGLEVDDIVERVRLPPRLAAHPYLEEIYGSVEWSVRGIVSWYIGWFDRSPVNLYPLSKQDRIERFADLLGKDFKSPTSGTDKMLKEAEEALEKIEKRLKSREEIVQDEVQWVLEMSSNVMRLTRPGTEEYDRAQKATKVSLNHLAALSVNQNAQRYYRTSAQELSTNFIEKVAWKGRSKKIREWPIDYSMKRIQFSLKSEDCFNDEKLVVVFQFPDVDQVHSYTMRHCILEYHDTPELVEKVFDVKATMSSDLWKELLTGKRNLSSAMENEEMKIDGKLEALQRFMSLLEMCSQPSNLQQKSVL